MFQVMFHCGDFPYGEKCVKTIAEAWKIVEDELNRLHDFGSSTWCSIPFTRTNDIISYNHGTSDQCILRNPPLKMQPSSQILVAVSKKYYFTVEAEGDLEFNNYVAILNGFGSYYPYQNRSFQECQRYCDLPHEICSNPFNRMTVPDYAKKENIQDFECDFYFPKQDVKKCKKEIRTIKKRDSKRRPCKLSDSAILFQDEAHCFRISRKSFSINNAF